MTSTPLLPEVSTRNWRKPVLFLPTAVLLLLGLVFVVSVSLSPPRFVKGTESTGYQYLLLGNEADVVTPTRSGLVLIEAGSPKVIQKTEKNE